MTITVGPTVPFPSHHATLSDGTTTVGFIFANSQGKIDPRAVRRYALSRTAIKTSTGSSKYSDLELPYLANAQDDWSGGRGQDTFEDDTSRYFDGCRVDTTRTNELFNAGLERYCYNYQAADSFQPSGAGAVWQALYGSTRYMVQEFVASSSYSTASVDLWVVKVGSPAVLFVTLLDGGYTGTALSTTLLSATVYAPDVTAYNVRATWSSPVALTSGNTYAIKVAGSSSSDATNHWMICTGTGSAGASYTSADDSAWTATTKDFYFRSTVANASTWWSFLEYKKGLYAVSHPVTGNSFLWKNGDRGAADSNAGVLTTLIDGTKTWVADEWIGCVAFVTQGPGSEEDQPWRVITDNDGTTLTVSPAWNVAHTTGTEYVILGSEKWTSVLDLGGYCTDACVADEFVYFARGDSGALNVLRFQSYNNAGTWTDRNDAENHKAVHLCAIRNTAKVGRMQLYGTFNNQQGGKVVWKMTVPRFWGDLYREIATITDPDQPFAEQAISNVTQVNSGWCTQVNVAAGFTTGVIASENISPALNISEGTGFGFDFMSSIALAANDLQLQYSDSAALAATANTLNFPAVIGSYTWEWEYLAFTMTAGSGPPPYIEEGVESIGLNQAVDKGAANYYISDGIFLVSSYPEYITLPNDANITGLIAYAGNATEPIVNPWVITENAIYEIQTQNSNAVVALPLGEIAEMNSEKNARGKAVNDVYFWFNLAGRLERYYSRNLDDIGPDRDAGLPATRSGWPRALLSYPGRVFAAIDAGTGTSSILTYKTGWHEVYRAPRANLPIYSMVVQTLPNDTNVSRMFFSQGCDICWMPIAINPPQSSTFKYAIEGHYESSWIYSGMQDVTKLFRSVTLFLNSGYNNSDYVFLDYKKDYDYAWTVVGSFSSGNLTNNELVIPGNITGKRLKLRLRIRSTITGCEVVKALLLKGIGIVPIKFGYTWQTKLTEGDLSSDLLDIRLNAHGTLTTTDLVLAKLDSWASGATPLTLRSGYSAVDNKTVFLNAVGLQPITYLPEIPAGPLEEYMVQIDCSEV